MKVCVFFECSERIKKAFMDRGHEAHSCDLKPGELGLPNHHQCDFRELLDEPFDLGIFHPDCTDVANSGVRWLFTIPGRYESMVESCRIFNLCLNAPNIKRKCLENPIQHKYARQFIRKYDQIIHPHYFGEPESKATCLWLVGLPILKRTHWLDKSEIRQSTWREAPSEERKTNRARTFNAVAEAMAEQWGNLLNTSSNQI